MNDCSAGVAPLLPEGRVGNLAYAAYLAGMAAVIVFVPASLRLAAATILIFGWGGLCARKKDFASSTGAVVTWLLIAITILSAWISNGTLTQTHSRLYREVVGNMTAVAERIEEFRDEHCYLPATFAQVELPDGWYDRYDPWGREFVYRQEGDGFQIQSLGRDGRPGGRGLDSDWEYSADQVYPDPQLPLGQYLFGTESTNPVVGLSAWFGLWLGHAVRTETARTSYRRRLLMAAGLLIVSVIVCTILSMFHVAAVQSSH